MAANTSLAGILELKNEDSSDTVNNTETEPAASGSAEKSDDQVAGDTAGSDTADGEEGLSLLERIGSDSTAADTGDAAALASEFADQTPLFAVLSPAIMTCQAGSHIPASGPTIVCASQRAPAKRRD